MGTSTNSEVIDDDVQLPFFFAIWLKCLREGDEGGTCYVAGAYCK